jgi:uncharacterized RDD family membrane protein YckC
MNISSLRSKLGLAFALLLPPTLTSFAQAPAPEKSATPAAPAPTSPVPDAAPAPVPPPAEPPVPAPEDRPPLRRIDQVDGAPAEAAPAPARRRSPARNGGGGDFPFGDHTVSSGSRIRDAVSILGSTTVAGEVDSDAVSVVGSTTVLRGARVGGAAVAVLGRLESDGEIEDDAVSVLGGMRINGPVGGEAVAVLGNLVLGPNAVIEGDLVVVGGKLTKDPNAIVRGNEVSVPVFGAFGDVDWLTTWLRRCAFYGRLLAFGPNLGWAWAIAFSFLAFYLLLALLFSRGITRCAETLETRPGYSILSAVLTVLLSPIAVVLLAVTIVGALLVPFLGAGLLFAGLFGKAVMLAWIGRRFTKFFGDGPLGHPAFAVLIGGLLVILLYTVPVLGFITYKLLSWLGLGVVVYTIALSMKREKRPPPAPPVSPLPAGEMEPVPAYPASAPYAAQAAVVPAVAGSGSVPPPMMSAGFSEASVGVAAPPPAAPEAGPAPMPASMEQPGTPLTPPPTSPSFQSSAASAGVPPPVMPMRPAARPQPSVPPAVAWPRAGFFIRLGALALDGILIGLLMAFLSGLLPRSSHFHNGPGGWLLALAIYGAIMWKHKGTTIGGIVCGLKVVRVDHRELDWATAIVRALACFLSLAVAGLGFIWVAIDDEKQSWHDKIAGTAVVLVPKGTPLV